MGTLGTGTQTRYPGSPDGTSATAIRELDALIEQMQRDDQTCLSPEELLTLSPADILQRVAAQLMQREGGDG